MKTELVTPGKLWILLRWIKEMETAATPPQEIVEGFYDDYVTNKQGMAGPVKDVSLKTFALNTTPTMPFFVYTSKNQPPQQ